MCEFYLKIKGIIDFYTVMEILMGNNLIPAADISEETKEKLKCRFLNKEYSYPIGLNAGIDTAGDVK